MGARLLLEDDRLIARRLWYEIETYHSIVYFASEVRLALQDAGVRGFWKGYFGGRAAPLGAVPASVVTATFFNFAPTMVERALPAVWEQAVPASLTEARYDGVGRFLRKTLGEGIDGSDMRWAASVAEDSLQGAQVGGRPLFAAYAALPWPVEPYMRLWQAATLLREHRGDGHVAVLTAQGLSGCEVHVMMAATGRVPRETLQVNRGWTDEDWAGATESLRERGWLNGRGRVTTDGREAIRNIERVTDSLAMAPCRVISDSFCKLLDVLQVLNASILRSAVIPFPNPMGLPAVDERPLRLASGL